MEPPSALSLPPFGGTSRAKRIRTPPVRPTCCERVRERPEEADAFAAERPKITFTDHARGTSMHASAASDRRARRAPPSEIRREVNLMVALKPRAAASLPRDRPAPGDASPGSHWDAIFRRFMRNVTVR